MKRSDKTVADDVIVEIVSTGGLVDEPDFIKLVIPKCCVKLFS